MDHRYQNTKFERILYFTFIFFFLIKLLESLYPFGNGDPLYYHLPLGKMIWTHGFAQAHKDVCGALQSGVFEYIYAIVTKILFNHWTYVLVIAQLLHFLLSQGIVAYVGYRVLRKQNLSVALLFGLSILLISKGSDFFLFAKNDGIVASLAFISCLLLVEFRDNEKLMRWFPIFSGLIATIKFSGLFVLIPINFLYIYLYRNNIKQIIKTFCIQFIILLPLLIRNYYFIGNPFFPGLIKLFPGLSNPTMVWAYSNMMNAPITLNAVLIQFKYFILGQNLYVLTIPLFISNIYYRYHRANLYFIISVFCFVLYEMANGGIPSERFIFSCYFLNAYFIFYSLLKYPKIITKQWYLVAMLVISIAGSKVDIKIKRIIQLPKFAKMTEDERQINSSPNTKAWKVIKDQFPNFDNSQTFHILSDDYNESFYAPQNFQLTIPYCHVNGYELDRCNKQDFENIKNKYQVAIMRFYYFDNECTRYIKSKPLFHKLNYYDFYKLK